MAIDELQRQLDANALRISNLGTPTTASDATYTDNTTAPANPTAAAAHGSSLLASPADHVHQAVHSVKADSNAQLFGDVQFISGSGIILTQSGQGITVAVVGGLINKVTWAEQGLSYVVGTGEQIIAEWNVNVDDAGSGAGPNVQARMAAIVKTTGGTATYKLYSGATSPGATTGGTVRATFTTASSSEAVAMNQGSAFANPGGTILFQVTAANSGGGNNSYIRGMSFSIG